VTVRTSLACWRRKLRRLTVAAAALTAAACGTTPTAPTAPASARHAPATAPATPAPTTARGTPGPETLACTKPCADAGGWIAELSNFRFDVSYSNEFVTPEAGDVFVTVYVTFMNKSKGTESANPVDFKLMSAGAEHDVDFMGPCGTWSSVQVAPGASYGPKCLAFQAKADQRTGLVVVWKPGLVTYDIPVS
jgi:hypothetical protein